MDWTIVPGVRVGPIDSSTSEAEVRAIFGGESVAATEVEIGEGSSVPGTVVFEDDPARRLEIVWRDSERESPKEVRFSGRSSVWATENGVSLGTTLKQLESLNGYPIRLTGFDFDYAGTVVDCGRGRLSYLGCRDSVRTMIVRFSSELQPAPPEYRQVVGDRVFSSGHPAMQAVNPTVYQIIVLVGEN
ncbi:MAG: hypothetical protein AAFR91_13360 [Pseudomonadota bacterium]